MWSIGPPGTHSMTGGKNFLPKQTIIPSRQYQQYTLKVHVLKLTIKIYQFTKSGVKFKSWNIKM